MSQGKKHESIRFEYSKGNDYRLVHATGAHGGMTPGGLIKFDLHSEFGVTPDYEEFTLTSEGKLADKISENEDAAKLHLKREVQVGVVMSPKDAYHLGTWLLEKVKQAEELSKSAASTTK
jgi:hypothetical protein